MLIRLLRTHLRPYAGSLAALVVLQLVATLAMLYLPNLTGRIIDEGVVRGDTDRILSLGSIMLVVSLGQVLATVAATRIASLASAGAAASIRATVFSRVGDFSAQEVSGFGAPTLISRCTNDVQQVQQVSQLSLTMMITAPISMVGGVAMAIHEDAGLAWLVAVAVPVLGVYIGVVVSRMLPSFRRMQEAIDSVNRILREQITGVRVVRAFVRQDHERARFEQANTTYTDTSLRVGRLFALAFPGAMLVLNLSMAGVIWFGAHRIEAGDMGVGQLTAFMNYLMQILMAVIMATMLTMMVPRASVSAGRIREVLDVEPTVRPPSAPSAVPEGPVTVTFDDVAFAYPGAEHAVLEGISFTARPGEVTAVIGSTGAGKTTLVDLVPRLHDVTSGAVRVNGVDVREVATEDLWARVGIVPQRAFLFSGTVASNVRYGAPDASDDEVWHALRIAQAADFVEAMGGLDAEIAQGGSNVSGGQRQRLAIARAVAKRPPVLVLDDAFSALDTATDARLRAALEPVTRECTVIVVAQRVSSIAAADRIVVLEDGQVVGIGRHDELVASCATYREIVESQAAVAGGAA